MSAIPSNTGAGALSTAPLIRRVSRRELAENIRMWHAVIAMFLLVSAVTIATLVTSGDDSRARLYPFLATIGSIALVFLRSQPPPMGSVRNHALLVAVYGSAGAGMFAFQPQPEIAIAMALFIGPLIAVRHHDRRAIIGHYIAVSALFYGLAIIGLVTGGLNTSSMLACVMIVFGTWALGTSCMIILEAAESQGDELERLVRRDPLTGVGNRRMLDEYLQDELPRHARTGRQLSLIALDLNGFKALNDTIGHAAGDDLLREVAEALTGSVGQRDVVIRQGGDEFCVVLPEASPVHARRTANSIRAALAKLEAGGRKVSSGFGIASYPDDADSGDVLLHLADLRLAQSKRP